MRSSILLAAFVALVGTTGSSASFTAQVDKPVFPFVPKDRLFGTCQDILFSNIQNTPGLTFGPTTVHDVKLNCQNFVTKKLGSGKRVDGTTVMDSCKEFQRVLEASLAEAFKQETVQKQAKKKPQKVASQFCGYFAAADSHLTSTGMIQYVPAEDRKAMCLAVVGLGTEPKQRKFTCESELRKTFQKYQMPTDTVTDACVEFIKVAEESEKTGTFGEGGKDFCSWAEQKSAWHAPFSAGEPIIAQFFEPTSAPPTAAPESETITAAAAFDVNMGEFADKVKHAYRTPTDAFWAMGGDLQTGMLSVDNFWPVCQVKLEMKKAACVAAFKKMDWSKDGAGDGKVSLKEWLDAIGMTVDDLRSLMDANSGGVDSAFRAADSNNDGALSREEFVTYVTSKPLDISEDNANKLFDAIDQPNHDGRLTEEEFTDHLGVTKTELAVRIHKNFGSLDSAFKALDTAKDGKLDQSELNHMFEVLHVPVQDRERLVKQLDQDGDGAVTEEELLRAFPADGQELRYRIYEHPELGTPADAFDRMDVTHDEHLTKPEFETGVEVYNVTKTDADAIFDAADKDKDELLSRNEFYKAVGYEPEVVVAKVAARRGTNGPFGTIIPWGKCAFGCTKGLVPDEVHVVANTAAHTDAEEPAIDQEDRDDAEEPVEEEAVPSEAPVNEAPHAEKEATHEEAQPMQEAEHAPVKDEHAAAPAPAHDEAAQPAPANDAAPVAAHAFVRRGILRATASLN